MGQALRPSARRIRVSLDWELIVVALMAAALLAGIMIRTEAPELRSQVALQVGGLSILSENETLVVFEDMSSGGGGGWSGGRPNADHPGLGAIWLADPPGDALHRAIALPDGTARVLVSFDLIAIDHWPDAALMVTVDGTEVLRHSFASRPDAIRATAPATDGTGRISLRTELGAPRELGFASGSPDLAEQRLSIEIAAPSPNPTLTLAITPLRVGGAEDAGPAPSWAVDNLIVVAERRP
jgi:hypothetical protein